MRVEISIELSDEYIIKYADLLHDKPERAKLPSDFIRLRNNNKNHMSNDTKEINHHLRQTKSQSHFIILKLVVICSQPTTINFKRLGDNSTFTRSDS